MVRTALTKSATRQMRRVGACSKVKPSWSAKDTQVSLTTGELRSKMAQARNFFRRERPGKPAPALRFTSGYTAEDLNTAFSKGASHMAKKLLLAAMLAAALSASAISVHQLRTGTQAIVACGSFCGSGDICKRPCGCCFGPGGGPVGTCQPECPAPARKK